MALKPLSQLGGVRPNYNGGRAWMYIARTDVYGPQRQTYDEAFKGLMVMYFVLPIITSPQMAAIVMVLACAVVISSSNLESHGWKQVVGTRAHVVVD